jgi:septum formation protein
LSAEIVRPSLILASSSPRRLELLAQIGIKPDLVLPANIDETPKKAELPKEYSIRIAIEKAEFIFKNNPDPKFIILACDTVCAVGRRILPKAESDNDVRECLQLLSGRRHQVYSSICVIKDGKKHLKTAISTLKFKRLTAEEIDFYVKSGEGLGKAGGCAIQGLGATFITFMSGSFSNIVGLPLYETANLLKPSIFYAK